jgi:hypothetical protein
VSAARALAYLVRTRWRNRLRAWLARLRTPTGMLGAALVVLVGASIVFGADFGSRLSQEERKAVLASLLGIMLVLGVLSGLGQRGLVFTRADLDLLFPAPIPRRLLLVYHFVPQYLLSAVMALVYLFLLGGRFLHAPVLFALGTLLCLMTNLHLGALAAELSMLLADRVHARLKRATTPVVALVAIGLLVLVVSGLGGVGGVGGWLSAAWASDLVRIAFQPAFQAVELGSARTLPEALVPLAALLAFTGGSFGLVLLLRVEFLEASYRTTRAVRTRVEQARRGIHVAGVARSASGPRAGWVRGAGAVLWLNALSMRRQARALLGGLVVVTMMLVVFVARSRGEGQDAMLLVLLAMVPLWMPLPVGFRLPREQLVALRQLPVRPERLAVALLTVPVVVPFLLQALAVLALAAFGVERWPLALAALPGCVAVAATTIGIDSAFVMRRENPNQVQLLQELAKVMLQMAALLPGASALVAVWVASQRGPAAILAGALVQGLVAYAVLVWLAGRLRRGLLVGL